MVQEDMSQRAVNRPFFSHYSFTLEADNVFHPIYPDMNSHFYNAAHMMTVKRALSCAYLLACKMSL